MPPGGFGVSEVFKGFPAGFDFSDDEAGGADGDDEGSANDADEVAVHDEIEHVFLEIGGVAREDVWIFGEEGDDEDDAGDHLPDSEDGDAPEEGPPAVPWFFFDGWEGGRLWSG